VSDTLSQAVKAARAHKPDVVLTDIESSKGSGIRLILSIQKVVPDAHIIVHTKSRSVEDFFSAISMRIAGYISKENNVASLVKIISLVAEGKFIIDPPMEEMVISGLKALYRYRHGAKLYQENTLTKREKAIMNLMADDATNEEIAKTFFITENTVKVHIQNIMHKLHAHHRSEITICAVKRNMQNSIDVLGP